MQFSPFELAGGYWLHVSHASVFAERKWSPPPLSSARRLNNHRRVLASLAADMGDDCRTSSDDDCQRRTTYASVHADGAHTYDRG
ncbi:MAG: hypothetical protein U0132_17605 [Gemmatimonadaceae bacterium]